MRTLSGVPTTKSCVQIYLWIRDTSLYRTASWIAMVSPIGRGSTECIVWEPLCRFRHPKGNQRQRCVRSQARHLVDISASPSLQIARTLLDLHWNRQQKLDTHIHRQLTSSHMTTLDVVCTDFWCKELNNYIRLQRCTQLSFNATNRIKELGISSTV